MRLTSPDFFIEPPIDFEHKKWLLLSFIKDIKDDFSNKILEPSIEQLTYKIKNLKKWKYSREFFLKSTNAGQIKSIDWGRLCFVYDIPEEAKEIIEINNIVEFGLDNLLPVHKIGREIFREIEQQIKWDTVGIVPNYKNEGYLLVQINKDINTYYYKIFMNYVDIELIDKREMSFFNTYENIKLDLIKERKSLPNPMVFILKTEQYPIEETIIPIIKKNLASKILI